MALSHELVQSPVWAGKQFLDQLGNLLNGGQIYTYAGGQFVNQATTYADNGTVLGQPTPNTNPIILDESGMMRTGWWIPKNTPFNYLLLDSSGRFVDQQVNVEVT